MKRRAKKIALTTDQKIVISTKLKLHLWLIFGTAAILLVSLAVSLVLEFIFMKFEVIPWEKFSGSLQVVIFSATSIIIGLALAFILGRLFLRPINEVIDGLTRLSEGDFSYRIEKSKQSVWRNMAEKFNAMATELERTEILRTDFVSEFTHELKTPVVSIKGLLPLLKNDELSSEKRSKYLAIMEAETERLVQMTANTLYLSKIETQAILKDKTEFNLSEQIRSCVLLLEKKWTSKKLELMVDFDDFTVNASEDMLKQVWINLIDNAIKFSYERGELSITIVDDEDIITVAVSNEGDTIPENERELIFGKFYQGDKSRSTEGNGIGLSIVKHIIELHKGKISVRSKNGITTFTVALPKK